MMVKKNPLKEIFEKIFWAIPEERRENFVIHILHRGAYKNIKVIKMTNVISFNNNYIHVKKQDEKDFNYSDEIPIPYHRILKIINILEEEVFYEKK